MRGVTGVEGSPDGAQVSASRERAPAGGKRVAGPRALLVISTLFLFFASAQSARAQDFSLGIYPPIIQIDALSPSEITTPITIENLSTESVILSIQLRQFVPKETENGEIEYIREADEPHKRLFDKVKIKEGSSSRTQVSLSPRQKKELTLAISLPKNETASDYYFSIIFVSKANINPNESESYAAGGIAANVLLSVGEKDLPRGKIIDFSSPFFVTKGPVSFKVRVENQSPFFITTEGNILIKNVFGQTIGNLELLPLNILGKSARFLGNKDGLDRNLEAPSAFWSEKFLLGIYTADLTVTLSEQGPILHDRHTFIAIPLEIILGFLITVFVVLFIYRRVKKKMQSYEQI